MNRRRLREIMTGRRIAAINERSAAAPAVAPTPAPSPAMPAAGKLPPGAADALDDAARALCRANCAIYGRDTVCQEHGRCGGNWRDFLPPAFATVRRDLEA